MGKLIYRRYFEIVLIMPTLCHPNIESPGYGTNKVFGNEKEDERAIVPTP